MMESARLPVRKMLLRLHPLMAIVKAVVTRQHVATLALIVWPCTTHAHGQVKQLGTSPTAETGMTHAPTDWPPLHNRSRAVARFNVTWSVFLWPQTMLRLTLCAPTAATKPTTT
jgi:hypothetical protein